MKSQKEYPQSLGDIEGLRRLKLSMENSPTFSKLNLENSPNLNISSGKLNIPSLLPLETPCGAVRNIANDYPITVTSSEVLVCLFIVYAVGCVT